MLRMAVHGSNQHFNAALRYNMALVLAHSTKAGQCHTAIPLNNSILRMATHGSDPAFNAAVRLLLYPHVIQYEASSSLSSNAGRKPSNRFQDTPWLWATSPPACSLCSSLFVLALGSVVAQVMPRIGATPPLNVGSQAQTQTRVTTLNISTPRCNP